ncbi:PD-(D/E)XK nuclease family protein [Pasteurellaceae bacterium 20609_3]|uniref:RecB family exonuclease n=1 Tax=Spirabiliibacterium mucosae TaxID=28156 RepID=UPI001AAD7F6C|nr:PD-(D/E)XK nuclease family protein [Spirabiliibacterium mucosae]MBE2897816.1 PD-(D/E)XK nuclease family protein [Spirabiliibacterium mucosae]
MKFSPKPLAKVTPHAKPSPSPAGAVFTAKPLKKTNEPTIETELTLGPIKTWSFSSLGSFEQCPRKLAYRRIDKIPEPSGEAAQRGSKIHDMAEQYVRGNLEELPKELERFKRGFEALKAAFAEGKVSCEEEWGFRTDWSCTEGWRDPGTWHLAKLDAFYREDDGSAMVIDYKTGRKFGNELKHGEQGLTYAIGAFMKYPELDFIKVEFWYLDKGEKLVREFTRDQALIFHPRLHSRGVAMTTATEFPATPSMNACKWCHYGKEGICPLVWDASQL